jgi:hypothetical protein
MSTLANRSFVLSFALLLVVGSISGCAGGKTTTVTTTVTKPVHMGTPPAPAVESQHAPSPSQETTVITTTTEERESSPGIVGSAFGFVGAVIAFPFRVVGGVLDAVF